MICSTVHCSTLIYLHLNPTKDLQLTQIHAATQLHGLFYHWLEVVFWPWGKTFRQRNMARNGPSQKREGESDTEGITPRENMTR